MNLNRLQSESQAALEDTQPSSSHSPQKGRSEEGNKFVFPHDICLFCDKKTTTSGGRIFKPIETITGWGHKKSGWTNTEQRTRDLQNDEYSGLLRKVAGVDFLATEAHFHPKFHSKHQTWTGYHRSSNADENVDLEMHAAHAIAYESVKSFIKNKTK